MPASRSGATRISARPETGETMPLAERRLLGHRIVERQRAVEDAARDLPAIGHLAQSRRVDGRADVGRHRLDRRQDRHSRRDDAQSANHVDRVLDDVAFVEQVGIDVDRRIGDEHRPRIVRRVDGEDVGDAARGAKAGRAVDDRAHQFVGVQGALHQRLDLAFARHRHAHHRGGVAVLALTISNPARSTLASSAARRIFSSGPTSTASISFSRAASTAPTSEASSHRMNDRGAQRLEAAHQVEQQPIPAALLVDFSAASMHPAARDLLRRRDDFGAAGEDRIAALIDGAQVERDAPTLALRPHRNRERHRVARRRRALVGERLANELRAEAGELSGDHRGRQRAGPAGGAGDRLETVGRHQARLRPRPGRARRRRARSVRNLRGSACGYRHACRRSPVRRTCGFRCGT